MSGLTSIVEQREDAVVEDLIGQASETAHPKAFGAERCHDTVRVERPGEVGFEIAGSEKKTTGIRSPAADGAPEALVQLGTEAGRHEDLVPPPRRTAVGDHRSIDSA